MAKHLSAHEPLTLGNGRFLAPLLSMLERQDVTGSELLGVLAAHSPLDRIFQASLRGRDGLDLYTHTLAVIRRFETDFTDSCPVPFTRSEFKFLLAVHDLGKPQAMVESAPWRQHAYTCSLIQHLADNLEIPPLLTSRIKCVVGIDPIGSVLNEKSLCPPSQAVAQIVAAAEILQVPVLRYWDTALIYYQCDVCGYDSLRRKVFVTNAADEPVRDTEFGRYLFRDADEAARFESLEKHLFASCAL